MKLKLLLFPLILLTFMNLHCAEKADSSPLNVLVFSKTEGYRHASIPEAIKAFAELGQEQNWKVTFTEDSSFFQSAILDKMDVVVFLMSSGDVLAPSQQSAFQSFIRDGGGFFGVHSGGTDTEHGWDWYAEMIGAHFSGHPPICEGKLIIEDKEHPATQSFPEKTVLWEDEFYSFDRNPRKEVDVLISVDEDSYDTENNPWFENQKLAMGDHPLVWCREFEGGRVIQTALGHADEKYRDPVFRGHLAGAVQWAAGLK